MTEDKNKEKDEGFDWCVLETPEEEKAVIRSMIGNKKIWTYFLELLKDKHFQKYIEGIRTHFLDKDGKPKDDMQMRGAIDRTCRRFGLDEVFWSAELYNYVLSGILPKENLCTPCVVMRREDIGEDEYPDGEYEENEEGFSFDDGPMKEPVELDGWAYSYPVIIRVSAYASQREIIDYIKKAYNKDIKPIQELYKDEDVYLGKVRKKKQSIQDRNEFIYKNKDLPRKEIMKMVNDAFPSKEPLEYGNVAKIISLEKMKREKK